MEYQQIIGKGFTGRGEGNFVLYEDERCKHVFCVGSSGVGKSTLMYNMAVQDMQAGKGFCLIDPHGDLAQSLIDVVPKERTNQVCYLDASDLSHPIGFNVLETTHRDQVAKTAAGVVSSIKHVYEGSWGPRLEHFLRNSAAALIEYPSGTLLCLPRFLMDEDYRDLVLKSVKDPMVRAFWFGEFPRYDKRFIMEALSPILNKISAYLAEPSLRHMLGQEKSTLHFDHAINRNRIVIVNLAKGQIGDTPARLLGALIISQIQIAAMARSKIPENERRNYYLYVDETHSLATPALTELLAESRKFKLGLVMATQHMHQVSNELRASIIGNVGSLIVFKVGIEDAEFFARQFAPLQVDEFSECLPYHAWARLEGWLKAHPVNMLPAIALPGGRRDKVIKQSRRHYGRHRAKVEEQIEKFLSEYVNG